MNKYQLAPYVRVKFDGDYLQMGCGSLQHIVLDKKLQQALLKASVWLINPLDLDEVRKKLSESDYSERTITQCIDILNDRMLLPESAYHKEDRYSRPLLYYGLSGADVENIQRKVSESHIAIIGCGGIGSLTASTLAATGVKQFTLVDRDDVEIPDLSSQILFTETDCGETRVSCVAKELRARRSDTVIHEICNDANKSILSYLRECSLIVITDEQSDFIQELDRFSRKCQIPYLVVSIDGDIVKCGPLVTPAHSGRLQNKKKDPFAKCVSKAMRIQCQKINTDYQAPSIGPMAMMAASLASTEILKYLGDFGEIASDRTLDSSSSSQSS